MFNVWSLFHWKKIPNAIAKKKLNTSEDTFASQIRFAHYFHHQLVLFMCATSEKYDHSKCKAKIGSSSSTNDIFIFESKDYWVGLRDVWRLIWVCAWQYSEKREKTYSSAVYKCSISYISHRKLCGMKNSRKHRQRWHVVRCCCFPFHWDDNVDNSLILTNMKNNWFVP